MSDDEKKLEIFDMLEGIEVSEPTKEDISQSRYAVLIFIRFLRSNIEADLPSAPENQKETYQSALDHLDAMEFQATIMPEEVFEDISKKSMACVKIEEIVDKDEEPEDDAPIIH